MQLPTLSAPESVPGTYDRVTLAAIAGAAQITGNPAVQIAAQPVVSFAAVIEAWAKVREPSPRVRQDLASIRGMIETLVIQLSARSCHRRV
jgi:hypothetical protein